MMIKDVIAKLVARETLTREEAAAAMTDIMSGEATEAQIGAGVPQPRPFRFNHLAEPIDAQLVDQDLDPRLVLVVAPAELVVDPENGFQV